MEGYSWAKDQRQAIIGLMTNSGVESKTPATGAGVKLEEVFSCFLPVLVLVLAAAWVVPALRGLAAVCLVIFLSGLVLWPCCILHNERMIRMTNTIKLREEAYRLSEKTLEAQFTAALSADQRAMSAAGITVAAAAILVGLAAGAANPAAMLLGAVFLVVGAMFAWRSAMPIGFYAPGSTYEAFKEDIDDDVSYERVVDDMGGWNDKHIKANRAAMSKNSKDVRRLFWLTIIGLAIAIGPQMYAMFI